MGKSRRKRKRTEQGLKYKIIKVEVEYSQLEATLSDITIANIADLSMPVELSCDQPFIHGDSAVPTMEAQCTEPVSLETL